VQSTKNLTTKVNEVLDRDKLLSLSLMLFFLIVIYLVANFMVMPQLDKNIELQNKLLIQETMSKYMKENRKHLLAQLQEFGDLRELIEPMEEGVDIVELVKELDPNAKVTKVSQEKQNGIKIEKFFIKATLDTPTPFFSFIQKLKEYPIMLEEPIEFEKSKDKIIVRFFLELYSFA